MMGIQCSNKETNNKVKVKVKVKTGTLNLGLIINAIPHIMLTRLALVEQGQIMITSIVIVKAKVFLSNVDQFILHLMLHLLLQNRAEPGPYSHIN